MLKHQTFLFMERVYESTFTANQHVILLQGKWTALKTHSSCY